jgi:hypothetical protein
MAEPADLIQNPETHTVHLPDCKRRSTYWPGVPGSRINWRLAHACSYCLPDGLLAWWRGSERDRGTT